MIWNFQNSLQRYLKQHLLGVKVSETWSPAMTPRFLEQTSARKARTFSSFGVSMRIERRRTLCSTLRRKELNVKPLKGAQI